MNNYHIKKIFFKYIVKISLKKKFPKMSNLENLDSKNGYFFSIFFLNKLLSYKKSKKKNNFLLIKKFSSEKNVKKFIFF